MADPFQARTVSSGGPAAQPDLGEADAARGGRDGGQRRTGRGTAGQCYDGRGYGGDSSSARIVLRSLAYVARLPTSLHDHRRAGHGKTDLEGDSAERKGPGETDLGEDGAARGGHVRGLRDIAADDGILWSGSSRGDRPGAARGGRVRGWRYTCFLS